MQPNQSQFLAIYETADKGKCLRALQPLVAGQAICYGTGQKLSNPTMHSLTLDGQIIDTDNELKFAAHSCEPNACFLDKKPALIALRDIAAGEEITIDYLATETIITHPFQCRCGSHKCRGWIG